MDMSREPFYPRIYRKNAAAQDRAMQLGEPAQSNYTWTCHKGHITPEFTGKMLRPRTYAYVLSELAQSKCTWTSHKSNFMREFAEKCRKADGAP